MYYVDLELKGFKRMALNQINRFKITPAERVQLILGTNGCGKSSLLSELTPLPANKDDYHKDGYKIITIVKDGITYVLTNAFSNKAEHSFKRDDEELNPGGTVTVQRELVKQIFGVLADTHELLTGREKFSEMSPARRREWFTRLSDVNYDYALKVFDRLRERLRDSTGALRDNKKRLVVETAKIVSEEDEQRLRTEIEELQTELNLLQAEQAPVTVSLNNLEHSRKEIVYSLERLLDPIVSGVKQFSELQTELGQFEDLDHTIEECRRQITEQETLLNVQHQEHNRLLETIGILRKTGEEGITVLKTRLETTRERRYTALAQRKLKIEGIDALMAQNALEAVYEPLQEILSALPSNPDRHFSAGNLQALNEKHHGFSNEIIRLDNRASQVAGEARQMRFHKEHDRLECPQCRFNWTPNYDEAVYQAKLAEQSQCETEAQKRRDEQAVVVAQLTDFETYRRLYGDYVRCTKAWPVLNPLWSHLSENVGTYPAKALNDIRIFREDLVYHLEADRFEQEVQQIQSLIIESEKVGDANLADSQARLDQNEELIANITARLVKAQYRLKQAQLYRRTGQQLQNDISNIEELLRRSEELSIEAMETERRTLIKEAIEQRQILLSVKVESLSNITLQKGIVTSLEQSIQRLLEDETALKALVRELSPTDGLIADGLLGFIRNYTRQMNKVIQRIWTYPLQVLPCGVAGSRGAELDYRFPLMVQTKDNVVPDVKSGSSGMKEIVDLAYKIIAMQYSGLGDAPLILDEFGIALDEEHRNAANHAIKAILEQCAFSQLYMVSHYAASYASFMQAETCVLDSRNITTPAVYNKHVIIE